MLRIVPHIVPRVGRSYKQFPDGFKLHLLILGVNLQARGSPGAGPSQDQMGGIAYSLIREHDHFTPTRDIKRHVRALARNHPEGWKLR